MFASYKTEETQSGVTTRGYAAVSENRKGRERREVTCARETAVENSTLRRLRLHISECQQWHSHAKITPQKSTYRCAETFRAPTKWILKHNTGCRLDMNNAARYAQWNTAKALKVLRSSWSHKIYAKEAR